MVTTWSFITAGATAGAAEQQTVATRLQEFFTVGVGAGSPLTNWLSPVLTQSARVVTYRMGEAPPRTPTVFNFTANISASGTPYPNEVALCCSFYADRNLPRQRGRIYFGPLRSTAGISSDGDARPDAPLRTALAGAASRLAAYSDVGTNSPFWGVLSRVDADIDIVTAGWIDNAFDTQRRRGRAPTTRTTWT